MGPGAAASSVEDFRAPSPTGSRWSARNPASAESSARWPTRYDADLYLPTGEISDTQIYLMARAAADDGRPLVVLYFADCDPAGWQMGISVSRKLQALKILLPEMPDFEVHRVALTPGQVREYGLPSTPLKATERRADPWRAAMGVEQTEIDALASLRPDLLRQIAGDAIAPFFDRTLDRRVSAARSRGLTRRRQAVRPGRGSEQLRRIRAEAAAPARDMRRADRRAQRGTADRPRADIDLPPLTIPGPMLIGTTHARPAHRLPVGRSPTSARR